jgi:phosphoglycolate phosphatase
VLGLLPKGTHDYAKFRTPAEVANYAARAGLESHAITGVAYNPLTEAFRCRRRRRQLHDGVSPWRLKRRRASRGEPARACPSTPCCSISTERSRTRRPISAPRSTACGGRGTRSRAARDAALASSHGARGLLRTGLGVLPEHPDYIALRDAFLAQYESALCVDTELFADVEALLDAIEARSLKWGIVTNKATRYTTPLIARLGLDQANGRPRLRRHDASSEAAPGSAARGRGTAWVSRRSGACTWVTRSATWRAGIAAGMRTIVARYGYIEAHEAPETWPADGHIHEPSALLDWLPS